MVCQYTGRPSLPPSLSSFLLLINTEVLLSYSFISLTPSRPPFLPRFFPKLSLATQLAFCLLAYLCFDSDARLLSCLPFLPPSLCRYPRLPLRAGRAKGGEGEEGREELKGEVEEGVREGHSVRRYPMFDWASGGREGRKRRWDDEMEGKKRGREGEEEESSLSPRLVIAGSPLVRVSEERERDRASAASLESRSWRGRKRRKGRLTAAVEQRQQQQRRRLGRTWPCRVVLAG